ncbi:hypothetical protein R70006_06687 [Paraburkholderia domus]|nr:hypothetical protein R70006_06687 [Paraburkholderia domus]
MFWKSVSVEKEQRDNPFPFEIWRFLSFLRWMNSTKPQIEKSYVLKTLGLQGTAYPRQRFIGITKNVGGDKANGYEHQMKSTIFFYLGNLQPAETGVWNIKKLDTHPQS